MKTVHVVTANDFPVGVCSNEQLARETIRVLKKEDKKNNPRRVHYKVYPFTIDEHFPPIGGNLDITLNDSKTS